MRLPELEQEFRVLTQYPLDLAAVRTSIIRGVSRRQRRRRTTALVASVAAVVIVAAGIGIVHESGITSSPVAAVPAWQLHARPVVIPPASTLIPYTVRNVVSPVTATVDAPSARDAVTGRQDVDTLYVAWQDPTVAGTATASLAGGSKLRPAEMTQRSYVITKTRDLPRWQLPPGGGATDLATSTTAVTTRASVSIVIGGRQAVIADDTRSAFAVTTGETRWISWQLTDARWVHAWVRTGGDFALTAFAKGVLETPTVFIRHVTLGVTAPGYTVEGASEVGTAKMSAGGEVELCPVGTQTIYDTALTQPCLTVSVMPQKVSALISKEISGR